MSSTTSDTSSVTSDPDDIVVDGFPPEVANDTRFLSLKSNSLTNQNYFRPISSWNADLPIDIIETCVNILKDPSKLPANERQQIIEELENELSHRCENMNAENEWNFKSMLGNSFAPFQRHDPHKSSIRVNVELPSSNINSNNVKYNLNKPIYDSERQCWKVGMDFVLVNDHERNIISEETNEDIKRDQETQTEENILTGKNTQKRSSALLTSLSKSRSEENLMYLQSDLIDCLEAQIVNNDVDYLALENIEKVFKHYNEKSPVKNIQSSLKNYKSIIQSNIRRYQKEVKGMKDQAESIIHIHYSTVTNSQFKIYSTNQLLLTDVEKQISLLILQLNSMKNIGKISDKNEFLESVNELKKIKFSHSLRLISQMVTNLKNETKALDKDLFVNYRKKDCKQK